VPSTLSLLATPLPAASSLVTYSVNVSGSQTASPTGSVVVSDDHGGTCTITSLSSGSGSCQIAESASFSPYIVTAQYPGDAVYGASGVTITEAAAVSSGGTASTGTDQISATASGGTDGVDAVTETQYASDPVKGLTDGSNFFDVAVSSGNTFKTVTIEDCNNVTGSSQLRWWDSGASSWSPVIGNPGPTFTAGSPGCVSVTLDSSTSPSVMQLTGTIFGAGIPSGLGITTTSLPNATPGVAYGPVSLQVGGVGQSAPGYTTTLKWKKISLPKGLKLSKTGTLSGTPSTKLKGGQGSVKVSVTETVTTLNGKHKVKTKTTVQATIPLTIT
jgi:hypothetical protein